MKYRDLMTRFYIILIISFVAETFPLRTFGQMSSVKINKIDSLVRAYSAIRQFNGNVLVVLKGEIIFCKSYGLSDFELNVLNDRQTKFRVGSITKQFTAMLIMQLKEKGILNIDSTVVTYLSWYPVHLGNKITIRHLLSHTSGLSNYTERSDFYSELAHLKMLPKEFALKYCTDSSLLFKPGSRFHYCNTDYYLLGLIIESVTGKSYAEVLQENILQKIGMQNSGVDSIEAVLFNRAKGYEYTYDGYVNADPINMATSTYAAGAMYSTVDDLLLWQKALYGKKLLKKEGDKMFFTPVINNHAFGLYINKLKTGKTAIGHPGGINGFSSFMVHFPEDNITIILLDNSASGKRGNLDNTSFGIYSILLDQPWQYPRMPLTLALTEIYLQKGVSQMLQEYQDFRNDSTYDLTRSKSFLNNFGYNLLIKGKIKESLQVLKLATEESPQNTNTLDSYAEALKTDGQFDRALEFYKKILTLKPSDQQAKKKIKVLEESQKK